MISIFMLPDKTKSKCKRNKNVKICFNWKSNFIVSNEIKNINDRLLWVIRSNILNWSKMSILSALLIESKCTNKEKVLIRKLCSLSKLWWKYMRFKNSVWSTYDDMKHQKIFSYQNIKSLRILLLTYLQENKQNTRL